MPSRNTRFKIFGSYILDPDLTIPSWSPTTLSRFLQEPTIAKLEEATEEE